MAIDRTCPREWHLLWMTSASLTHSSFCSSMKLPRASYALAWVDTCSCVRASMTTCVRKVRIRGMNHNECLLWSRKIKSLTFHSITSSVHLSSIRSFRTSLPLWLPIKSSWNEKSSLIIRVFSRKYNTKIFRISNKYDSKKKKKKSNNSRN